MTVVFPLTFRAVRTPTQMPSILREISSVDIRELTESFTAISIRDFVKTANVIYSASHNFSTRLNPNSVWSYGFTTRVGGPFTLYATSGTTFFSGEVGWFGPIPGVPLRGSHWLWRPPGVVPNVLDMGPGPSSYTVVRWTAPSRGRWDVVGEFFGTGLTTGDVHVLRNGSAVFNSPLNGSDAAPFSLTIDVVPGDTIDFAAGPGPGGNNDFDPTGFMSRSPQNCDLSILIFDTSSVAEDKDHAHSAAAQLLDDVVVQEIVWPIVRRCVALRGGFMFRTRHRLVNESDSGTSVSNPEHCFDRVTVEAVMTSGFSAESRK